AACKACPPEGDLTQHHHRSSDLNLNGSASSESASSVLKPHSSGAPYVAFLDYLNVISIGSVVFNHCASTSLSLEKQNERLEYFLHDITRFAVPCLLFRTGYLF